MADYRVDVEVNVDDGKLDALESRIKGLKSESIKINADVDSKNIGSSVEKAMSNVRKHINVTGFKLGSGAIGFDAKSIKADSKKIQSDLIKDMSDADRARVERLFDLQERMKTLNHKAADYNTPKDAALEARHQVSELRKEYNKVYGDIENMPKKVADALDSAYSADKMPVKQTSETYQALIKTANEFNKENAKLEGMRLLGVDEKDIAKQEDAVARLRERYNDYYESFGKEQLSEGQLNQLATIRHQGFTDAEKELAKIQEKFDAEEIERVKNQASKEDQVRIDRMTELQNKIKSNNWKMGDIDLPVEEFDRLQKETQEASNEFDRLRGKIDSLSGENMGKLDALYGADKGQLQQTKEDVDGLISKMKEYGRESAKLESMRISGASADDIDKQQQAVDKLGKSIRETYSSLDKSQLSEKQLSKVAEARAKAIKQSNDSIAKAQSKQTLEDFNNLKEFERNVFVASQTGEIFSWVKHV